MPDIIDRRHDRSGQVVSEPLAECVSVDLRFNLSALLASDGARLAFLLDGHVLADMRNALFELLEEVADGRNRGDRAVNVMVGEVRRFQIGRLADLILVCPAVFLTGRMAVLLEQTLAGKGNGLVAQNGGGNIRMENGKCQLQS